MKKILILIVILISFESCEDSHFLAPPVYTNFKVNKLEPEFGVPGDSLRIIGIGFGTDVSNIKIYMLGKQAQILDLSDNNVLIIVPEIAPGYTAIKMKSKDSSITSPMNFRVDYLKLNKMEPTSQIPNGEVNFYLSNFNKYNHLEVYFNDNRADVISIKDSSIKVKVSSSDFGKATIKIKSSIQQVVDSSFIILDPEVLKNYYIKSITPDSGFKGDLVNIAIKNYGVDLSQAIVTFGTLRVDVMKTTDSSIIVQVPYNGSFGTQPVKVSLGNFTSKSPKDFNTLRTRYNFHFADISISNVVMRRVKHDMSTYFMQNQWIHYDTTYVDTVLKSYNLLYDFVYDTYYHKNLSDGDTIYFNCSNPGVLDTFKCVINSKNHTLDNVYYFKVSSLTGQDNRKESSGWVSIIPSIDFHIEPTGEYTRTIAYPEIYDFPFRVYELYSYEFSAGKLSEQKYIDYYLVSPTDSTQLKVTLIPN